MEIRKRDLKVARVLHSDSEFATLEVGKNDKVTFHLRQDPETGETVGGDEFLTLLFLRSDGEGAMEVWDPWAEE